MRWKLTKHAAYAHYMRHKEQSRAHILSRLHHYNAHYQYQWNRVAIRNQRTRWGSCSSKRNLNFNYLLYFLPPALADYVVVHELCHLAQFNHSPRFWALVAEQIPDYRARVCELHTLEERWRSRRL